MTRYLSRDRIVAVFILAGSLVWRHLALQMPPSYVKGVPGPAFFPLAIAACLVILSLVLFFRRSTPSEGTSTPVLTLRQLVVFALMFLYILLVPVLGFATATVLSLTAIMLSTRQLSLPVTAGTALIIGAALHIFFKTFLQIPLPGGILF